MGIKAPIDCTESSLAAWDQRFDTLHSSLQAIVTYFAVADCDLTNTGLARCLNLAQIRNSDGKVYKSGSVFEDVRRLGEDGFLSPRFYSLPQTNAARAVRLAVERGILAKVMEILEAVHVANRGLGAVAASSENIGRRDVWWALWKGQEALFLKLLSNYVMAHPRQIHPMVRWFSRPFDPKECEKWPISIQFCIVREILRDSCPRLCRADGPLAYLQVLCEQGEPSDEDLICLAEALIFRGKLEKARTVIGYKIDTFPVQRGWLASLEGERRSSLSFFQRPFSLFGKKLDVTTIFPSFYYLAELLFQDSDESLEKGLVIVTMLDSFFPGETTFADVWRTAFLHRKTNGSSKKHFNYSLFEYDTPIASLVQGLAFLWFGKELVNFPGRLPAMYKEAVDAGYLLIAGEIARILILLKERGIVKTFASSNHQNLLESNREWGIHNSLADAMKQGGNWERVLDKLIKFKVDVPDTSKNKSKPKAKSNSRLAWFIEVLDGDLSVSPREQKAGAKGKWSKGRPVALERLLKKHLAFLTPEDRNVCAWISCETYHSYGYPQTIYSFNEQKVALALIGHPLLFRADDPTTQVMIARGEPELRVKRKGEYFHLSFFPRFKDGYSVWVEEETPTRVKVTRLNADHQDLLKILGQSLLVPKQEIKMVHQVIANLSGVLSIQSDSAGASGSLKEVAPNKKIHLQLWPFGEGLRVLLRVVPLGGERPCFPPGSGAGTLIGEQEKQRVQARRNLKEEILLAERVVSACPTIHISREADWEWVLAEPEQCLSLLQELQALEHEVVVNWPEGVTFSLAPRVTMATSALSLRQCKDWFEIDGKVVVDESLTLKFRDLLDRLASSPGRFVELNDRRFFALSDRFRRFLGQLETFGVKTGKGIRFHPAAALALDSFREEMRGMKTDKHWKAHVARMESGLSLAPEVPSTLQAELRDYQIEGFCWLARLAHWRFGACLADDMGLGKTVQALGIILARAAQGPTLVVAPTSVAVNWVGEIARFAPSLRVHIFGGKKRAELIEKLGPFDLLVCSYGLLQQVSDIPVTWRTLVLDEAQAIKNARTKRAAAARSLSAEFRLIMTGTPIENHLGELWSLFDFINPGLLGSEKQFNQRFTSAAGAETDASTRSVLKKLIRPFLLRRHKSQVLEELPPKTEIIMHVEQDREEAAFYEALRRQALEALSGKEDQFTPILAQIMRLHRACCHPRLIAPDSSLPGAKLMVLGTLLDDLLANRHKALVFSQFVDQLKIIAGYLDQRGISYQYLDGSTPTRKRAKAIDAFQRGEGDIFLISLRAGGTGLNLTAADYVIHMDPWWNPAVEDQASDRAHRLGQQRPVTVYRLITTNTIEDKIVALHREKRALVTCLLEGGELAGRMTAENLLHLIQEAT